MQRAVGVIFLFSWLLAGCSVDQVFDDWRATLIFVIAFATAILCAAALGTRDK